jgi:DegV family protein with EDD domain
MSPSIRGVVVIPLSCRLEGQIYEDGEVKKVTGLPSQATDALSPRLIAPSTEKIYEYLSSLALTCDGILGIFMSSKLSGIFANAQSAGTALRSGVNISIIDSQTTSIGLGLIVEAAADAAAAGKSLNEIEQLVRHLTNQVYGVICTPSPSYLYYNGFLDRAQATISEMLGLYPIFTVEEGNLSPMEKVRNHRHTINYFQEFMDEFEDLKHIAFLQSCPPVNSEVHILRDHIRECFEKTPFTAHSINLSLASLFGPKTIGLFIMEDNH